MNWKKCISSNPLRYVVIACAVLGICIYNALPRRILYVKQVGLELIVFEMQAGSGGFLRLFVPGDNVVAYKIVVYCGGREEVHYIRWDSFKAQVVRPRLRNEEISIIFTDKYKLSYLVTHTCGLTNWNVRAADQSILNEF